ncbi:hypothetical protein CEK62_19835 [Alcanivorax sp. N3-2A]|nr:hypothetical protein CEK62_19835 [Alcanivorax sp. N3-2A]
MSLHKHFVTDVLIVGTGLAAITVALHLPDNLRALLVTKGTRSETNSMRAQGGIASSALEDDHEAHRADTVRAAKGWVNPEAVEFVTREGRTVKCMVSKRRAMALKPVVIQHRLLLGVSAYCTAIVLT